MWLVAAPTAASVADGDSPCAYRSFPEVPRTSKPSELDDSVWSGSRCRRQQSSQRIHLVDQVAIKQARGTSLNAVVRLSFNFSHV